MMPRDSNKRCLIISQGPVPSPEHTKVEGGGLRCWGLAKGLYANGITEVTVAYHDSYKKEPFTSEYEGIELVTWDNETVGQLLQNYDTIIVSYCMGDLSVAVADTINPHQQLILDCYVPIYVEVSARDSDDPDREYAAFHQDVGNWGHVLKRGDLFLCSSEAQKNYYKGVLSALGRINPITYHDQMIHVVPYGIYRDQAHASAKPISKLLTKKESKKILWFGGIYPWFDLRTLVDSIKLLNESVEATLVIVGARNPFNTHPDFVRKYDELMQYIESSQAGEYIKVQDWIKFEDRADWYLDSDVVVVVNQEGPENELAWRTRLVDFMWADLPIITNGGDPLGETLITWGAAVRFNGLTPKQMSTDLSSLLKDEKTTTSLKANLAKLKKEFYWDTVTKVLAASISNHVKATDLEKYGDYAVNLPAARSKQQKIKSLALNAKLIPAYARKHGTKNTYYAIRTKIKNRLNNVRGIKRTAPGIVLVAHQLDLSGAPYVFMDLTQSLIKKAVNIPVEFHTFNPTHKDNIIRLNKMGIKPNIHVIRDIQLSFIKGDIVVLNTVAHSLLLKQSIYSALENDTVTRLVWFIHEDEPELLFDKAEIKKLKNLLEKDKIVMYIAAEKATKNYQKTFGNTANIRKHPYKYVIPERFHKVRGEKEFDTIDFILTGNVADGRKGQLPVLYAFQAFMKQYYEANPKTYRDFTVAYVGLSHDFLSKQITKHAPKLLGNRFRHYGQVPHERSFELMMKANVTICYSLRECLPLFVFEGMAAGHPIMRNDSSGMEEQLFPGKNGFYLDSTDYNQIVDTIEEVLNREKTSNTKLASMSAYSNRIAREQAKNSYELMVQDILGKVNR